jgi:hypothetical protein
MRTLIPLPFFLKGFQNKQTLSRREWSCLVCRPIFRAPRVFYCNSAFLPAGTGMIQFSLRLLFILASGSCLVSAAEKKSPVSIEKVELMDCQPAKKDPAEEKPVVAVGTAPKPGAKPAPVMKQSKQLKITLRKSSSSDFQSQLVVKYWIIGRDTVSNKPVAASVGESKWDVKPADRGKEIVSEPYYGSYTLKSPNQKPGAAAPAMGGAAAPSIKVVGYGVKVLLADKVVAEAYSEEPFKQGIESGTITAPAAKME